MSWTSERARVASLCRTRTPDDPDLLDARRALRAEKLADHITRVLDQTPPLSAAQLDLLAALLRPGTSETAGANATRERGR